MDAQGRPIALNSPVSHDPESDTYAIRAKDEEDMKRLIDRYARKAAVEGKSISTGEPEFRSYQPSVTVNVQVIPQHWERMAAKVLLGFLAENLPSAWRASAQADALRAVMRAPDKRADEVRLTAPGAMQHVATTPASAAFTHSIGDQTVAGVSLLGQFMLGFAVPGDDPRLLWISDPLFPSWSVVGPWESALAERLGYLSAQPEDEGDEDDDS
jgi:phosphoribosylformylglycinamidine (FGAM) synthase-like enzyme